MFNDTLLKLANAVVDANRNQTIDALLNAHYAEDCVSVEGAASPGMDRAAEGLDAIRAKHAWWNNSMEFRGGEITGPFLFEPDRFAVRYTMDVTNKETGERTQAEEVAVYTVSGGKIVREEFFWTNG